LKAHITKTRPDFIFFDAQYIGEDITLNTRFVEEIKAIYDVRIIGAMCDAWDNVGVPMTNYWGLPNEPYTILERFRQGYLYQLLGNV
jgi:hypothetical protein